MTTVPHLCGGLRISANSALNYISGYLRSNANIAKNVVKIHYSIIYFNTKQLRSFGNKNIFYGFFKRENKHQKCPRLVFRRQSTFLFILCSLRAWNNKFHQNCIQLIGHFELWIRFTVSALKNLNFQGIFTYFILFTQSNRHIRHIRHLHTMNFMCL